MIVRLPWPDKRLNPNAKRRLHWRAYQPVIKKARLDAWGATFEAAQSADELVEHFLSDAPIPLRIVITPPDHRHRDRDNMQSMQKAYLDGIADALNVNDRRFRPTYDFAEPCAPGGVEIII